MVKILELMKAFCVSRKFCTFQELEREHQKCIGILVPHPFSDACMLVDLFEFLKKNGIEDSHPLLKNFIEENIDRDKLIIWKEVQLMNTVELMRNFCELHSDYNFYEDGYSGRGMFGKKCVGIVVREGGSYMQMLMELTRFLEQNDFDDIALELSTPAVDALGLDCIVYFPHILMQ